MTDRLLPTIDRRLLAVACILPLILVAGAAGIWHYLTYGPPPPPPRLARPNHYLLATLNARVDLNQPVFIASDGNTLVAGGIAGSKLNFTTWSASTLQPLGQFSLDYVPDGTRTLLALSPDGHLAALGGKDGAVAIVDLRTGKTLRSLSVYGGPTFIAGRFSPDSISFFAVRTGGVSSPGIDGWDVNSGAPLGRVGTNVAVSVVAPSPDRNHVLFGGSDATALKMMELQGGTGAGAGKLMELQRSGNIMRTPFFIGRFGPISAVAYSSDGSRAISGGGGGETIVWNDQTDKIIRRFRPHLPANNPFDASAVALSPRGEIAAAGIGNLLIIFDVSSNRESARLTGHSRRITALCFLGDAEHLASAAEDGTVRLWDIPVSQ